LSQVEAGIAILVLVRTAEIWGGVHPPGARGDSSERKGSGQSPETRKKRKKFEASKKKKKRKLPDQLFGDRNLGRGKKGRPPFPGGKTPLRILGGGPQIQRVLPHKGGGKIGMEGTNILWGSKGSLLGKRGNLQGENRHLKRTVNGVNPKVT